KTLPHPGAPTGTQTQTTALRLCCGGTSVIRETVFGKSFMHAEECRRMNAQLRIESRSVVSDGRPQLQGSELATTDLRAAAALILAGLGAKDYTRVSELQRLERGYVNFVGNLASLGANIERVNADGHVIEPVVQVEGKPGKSGKIIAELS